MNLIRTPRVFLISRPVLEPDVVLAFLKQEEMEWPELQRKLESAVDLGDLDGDWIPELAGRVCYMSFGKGRTHADYISHILEVGHGSVLEHSYYNFIITGISRACSHEIVRHRAGTSFSQLSQRYVDESSTDFVVPPGVRALAEKDPVRYDMWVKICGDAREFYGTLTKGLMEVYSDIPDKTDRRKKARQAARSVLPNATETKMYLGANIRALRHMIEMRAHPAADLEIRELYVLIYREVARVAPECFKDMTVVDLPDGTKGVESLHRKV